MGFCLLIVFSRLAFPFRKTIDIANLSCSWISSHSVDHFIPASCFCSVKPFWTLWRSSDFSSKLLSGDFQIFFRTIKSKIFGRNILIPGDSKWPFHPLIGGHLTISKGHLTIPKRSQRIARSSLCLLPFWGFFNGQNRRIRWHLDCVWESPFRLDLLVEL